MSKSILKSKIKEYGYTYKSISEKILNEYSYKISKESIAKYADGSRTPEPKLLVILSDILHVTVDYLIGNKTSAVSKIPIIGIASCGGVNLNHLQGMGKTALYNGDFYTPELYCVIASGDSMASEIEDGDEIICDPNIMPKSGDMVHYKIRNDSAIKILWEDEDANIVQFIPYNTSDTFKTITIRKDDEIYNNLILSKVVAVNKLKFHNRAARLRQIGRG
ncbi:hypothetical protein C9926_02115 [Sulfurovum lithotrophicum]|nr:hypothetical protein C9926_02115 [Sulfurovum lithotrophicum]